MVTALYPKIYKAFQVSVPLVSLETNDPAHSVLQLQQEFSQDATVSLVQWDCVTGLRPLNPAGDRAVSVLTTGAGDSVGGSLGELLTAIYSKATTEGGLRKVVVIIHNAQRHLEHAFEVQALWNCRDNCKAQQVMLVLLHCGMTVPPELQHDIMQFVEPLPEEAELAKKVAELVAGCPEIRTDEREIQDVARAALGCTAFAAENMAAMNLRMSGFEVDGVWEAKRKKIDSTPGLSMAGSGSFETIGGVQQIKKFLRGILSGKDKPNAVVFLDEIEKSLGGAAGDTSGVGQDQLGCLLSYMQDHRASGCIMLGPPGAAKSAICKATGAEAKIPTIQLDLGSTKGSLVGQSEQQLRDALKVITAVSGGKTLFLATCNSLGSLPPELRRRFKLGIWFFDLPTHAEREAIWKLYTKRFGIKEKPGVLVSESWTGAEIESCCEIAWRIGCSLTEASQYIVPVSKASSESIEMLRSGAVGKFLSASYPGPYTRMQQEEPAKQRKMEIAP